MYYQRFLFQPLLSSSLIIILILSHYFKSLLEELTVYYIFNYFDFIKNFSNHSSKDFKSSFYHENIFILNRFKEIATVFHFLMSRFEHTSFKFFKSSLSQLHDVQCSSELLEVHLYLNYSKFIFIWIIRISSSFELFDVHLHLNYSMLKVINKTLNWFCI